MCTPICARPSAEKCFALQLHVHWYPGFLTNSFIYVIRLEGIGAFQDAFVLFLTTTYLWRYVAGPPPPSLVNTLLLRITIGNTNSNQYNNYQFIRTKHYKRPSMYGVPKYRTVLGAYVNLAYVPILPKHHK